MLKQKTKDIEVAGQKYRLTRMDARTGSYVAAKLALMCAPLLGSQDKALDEDNIAKMLPMLNRRDFDELQTIALKTVRKLVGPEGMEMPIVKGNGVFVDEDLMYEVSTVINLTIQAAFFNVGDFFAEAGLLSPAKQ